MTPDAARSATKPATDAMLLLTDLTGFNAQLAFPAATITFLGSIGSSVDTATYGLSLNLTAGVYSHYIIGVIGASANTTTVLNTGPTLAGSAMAIAHQFTGSTGSGNCTAICIIANPGVSGSQTVSCTFSQTCARAMFAGWGVNNLLSMTPVDVGSSNADPTVDNLNFSAGGIGVAMGTSSTNATKVGVNLTLDLNTTQESINQQIAGLSAAFAAAQSNLSVGVNWNAVSNPAMTMVSFR